jgi:hypothetical protein
MQIYEDLFAAEELAAWQFDGVVGGDSTQPPSHLPMQALPSQIPNLGPPSQLPNPPASPTTTGVGAFSIGWTNVAPDWPADLIY